MRIRRLTNSSILSLVCLAIACNDGSGGPIPDPDFDSESAGLGTAGPGNGTGDAEGVHETGDGGPVAADHCLIDPIDEHYGYKYQCAGDVAVGVLIEGGFPGSPVTPPSLQLEFGHGIPGDSYEEPHVMACCPPYDTSAPNCGQPHERACMIDLVEQGCKSIVTNLEDFAHDELGGIGNEIARNAVLRLSDYVRSHQADCVDAFRSETGIASTLPSCDMDDNGVGFDSMLESGIWTFDPGGVINNVEMSIQAANWTAIHPLEDSPSICWSADENDGVLFLEIDPDPESKVLHLVAGSAALRGPLLDDGRVEGIGELSSQTSRLAILSNAATDGTTLENLELHSAGPAWVGTAEATWPVESFHIRLWDRTTAQQTGEVWSIPTGSARFAVSAVGPGVRGVITVENATPIEIAKDGATWLVSGFTIEHRDADDLWSLDIVPTRWQ